MHFDGLSDTITRTFNALQGKSCCNRRPPWQHFTDDHAEEPTAVHTQMVWHNTKEMDVGVAYCSSAGVLVVASYYPAGNWGG